MSGNKTANHASPPMDGYVTTKVSVDIISALARAIVYAARGDICMVVSGLQEVLGHLGLTTLSQDDNAVAVARILKTENDK